VEAALNQLAAPVNRDRAGDITDVRTEPVWRLDCELGGVERRGDRSEMVLDPLPIHLRASQQRQERLVEVEAPVLRQELARCSITPPYRGVLQPGHQQHVGGDTRRKGTRGHLIVQRLGFVQRLRKGTHPAYSVLAAFAYPATPCILPQHRFLKRRQGSRGIQDDAPSAEPTGQVVTTQHCLRRAERVVRYVRHFEQHAAIDELAELHFRARSFQYQVDVQIGRRREPGVVGEPVRRPGEVGAKEARRLASQRQYPVPRRRLGLFDEHQWKCPR